jgi:hypothetical protein
MKAFRSSAVKITLEAVVWEYRKSKDSTRYSVGKGLKEGETVQRSKRKGRKNGEQNTVNKEDGQMNKRLGRK